MWIESIDFGDFGHFDRARVRELEEGLTVIAGPQRAGKTTFMEAIRYLGYGLTPGTPVPPPTDRYDVAATVRKDGFRYDIELDGYADPAVTKHDDRAPDQTARELFGDVRKTQYQQLYTVTLDELSRDPDSLGDDVDLSSVLLEAAAGGDITDVPDLRDEFAERAKAIGGKHGRASYELKGPLETIREGIDARAEATDQVDEYERKTAEKAALEKRIEEIDAAISDTKTERTRLDAVVAGHDTHQELQACRAELDSMDVADVDSFPVDHLDRAADLRDGLETERQAFQTARRSFESNVGKSKPDQYRKGLLEARESIDRFARELSGWEQRVETLQDRESDLETTRQDLERTAADLGADWNGDPLEAVRRMETDLISREELAQVVARYKSITVDIDELSQAIAELESRRDDLEKRIEKAGDGVESISLGDVVPIAAVGSLLGLAAGGGAAIAVHPLAGVVVTALVFLATGGYVLSGIDTATHSEGVSVETLRAEAGKVTTELAAKRDRLDDRETDLDDLEATLETVREQYELPHDVSARAIDRFHEQLVDLEDRLSEYESAKRGYEDDRDQLREELEAVHQTLLDVGVLQKPVGDPYQQASEIFVGVERAVEHLESARAVEEAAQDLTAVTEEIVALLEEWDETTAVNEATEDIADGLEQFLAYGSRVREYQNLRERRDELKNTLRNQLRVEPYAEALESVVDSDCADESASDTWLLEAYELVFEEYGSIDDVVRHREELEEHIEHLEAEQESTREELAALERDLEELASDTEVREAHETIEAGRRQLEPLAAEYASLRIAEHLLDELHERVIDRTTGDLLAEASDIFERITGSEYTEITANSAFDGLDFEAVLRDGGVQQTTELSRATAEQLFLAVRLARIRRNPEPLPVLLDDSLTNFDPGHVQRTLDVINELAADGQVFLLTCHPTLVERVADRYDAQYWALSDGTFDGPYRWPREVLTVFD